MQILVSQAKGPAIAALGLAALLWSSTIGAAPPQRGSAADGKDQPYVIEYYYKAKWGHAEEFLALFKQLYPDQDTFKKEEQRRFEILEAHWDLPIKDVDLEAR